MRSTCTNTAALSRPVSSCRRVHSSLTSDPPGRHIHGKPGFSLLTSRGEKQRENDPTSLLICNLSKHCKQEFIVLLVPVVCWSHLVEPAKLWLWLRCVNHGVACVFVSQPFSTVLVREKVTVTLLLYVAPHRRKMGAGPNAQREDSEGPPTVRQLTMCDFTLACCVLDQTGRIQSELWAVRLCPRLVAVVTISTPTRGRSVHPAVDEEELSNPSS